LIGQFAKKGRFSKRILMMRWHQHTTAFRTWYLVLVIHSVLDVVGYSLVLLDLSRKTRLSSTGQ